MSAAKPAFEPAVGRYSGLDIAGKPHRIYAVEQAGEGILSWPAHWPRLRRPAISRPLNDPETLARFRVIAFDLPWHGKSSCRPTSTSRAIQVHLAHPRRHPSWP